MPETGSSEARHVTERVRIKVADNPIEIEGIAISVTVSMGIAEMDMTTRSLEELIKHADQALYTAKANGRNRIESYSPTDSLQSRNL